MMDHIKYIFTAVLPLFFVLGLQAQELRSFNEDSLKNLLKNVGKNAARVDILLKLSESYRLKNPDSAALYGDKAIALSRELNFTEGIGRGLILSGDARRPLGRYTEAIRMAQELLRLGEQLNDEYYQSTAIGFIGINYSELHLNIVPQDIGRVILNLINNAFYAVGEKAKTSGKEYTPTVKVSTRRLENVVEINVEDNGGGIPDEIKSKIFQPFFTTKPTGQGTGLGLSLAYDIITKGHGGNLKVVTRKGEMSSFIIMLSIN
jgi:signal transduction histidine kinase